jgi:hypothetical protein
VAQAQRLAHHTKRFRLGMPFMPGTSIGEPARGLRAQPGQRRGSHIHFVKIPQFRPIQLATIHFSAIFKITFRMHISGDFLLFEMWAGQLMVLIKAFIRPDTKGQAQRKR